MTVVENLRSIISETPSAATASGQRRKLSRRALVAGGAVIILAAAAWGGAHYWMVGRFIQSTDDAYVQADATLLTPKVAGSLGRPRYSAGQPGRCSRRTDRSTAFLYLLAGQGRLTDSDAADDFQLANGPLGAPLACQEDTSPDART